MNKQEFLRRLSEALSGLPKGDREDRVSFYGEMIDDRIEEGLSEEQAAAAVGSVDEIAAEIISETPLYKLVREKAAPKRHLKTWETVLLALGAPVWLSLLLSAFAAVFALYASLWSVIVSLWATCVSFAAGALGAVIFGVAASVCGNALAGIAALGALFFLAGLAVFLFFGCRFVTKSTLLLTKKTVLGIKKQLVRREKTNE